MPFGPSWCTLCTLTKNTVWSIILDIRCYIICLAPMSRSHVPYTRCILSHLSHVPPSPLSLQGPTESETSFSSVQLLLVKSFQGVLQQLTMTMMVRIVGRHIYMVVSPMAHVAINASVCVYLSAHKLGPRGVFCSGKQMYNIANIAKYSKYSNV